MHCVLLPTLGGTDGAEKAATRQHDSVQPGLKPADGRIAYSRPDETVSFGPCQSDLANRLPHHFADSVAVMGSARVTAVTAFIVQYEIQCSTNVVFKR
jgi:hypothetical protein